MKYCTYCGTQLLDQAVVCPKCGCAVDESFASKRSEPAWNTLAIVGFILSFVNTIVGLVLSIIAYKQIQSSGEQGKGLAKAGIIISSVSIGVSLITSLIASLVYIVYFVVFLRFISGV